MANKRYTLAHPLTDGNPYTGKKADAGQPVSLSPDDAAVLADAGYLAGENDEPAAPAKS